MEKNMETTTYHVGFRVKGLEMGLGMRVEGSTGV